MYIYNNMYIGNMSPLGYKRTHQHAVFIVPWSHYIWYKLPEVIASTMISHLTSINLKSWYCP